MSGKGMNVRQGVVQQTQWSGPLPPPEALKTFEQTVPGAAERILKLAEAEAYSRMRREEAQTEADIAARDNDLKAYHTRVARGQVIGAIIAMAFLVGAIVCAYFHETAIGVSVAGVTLVGIINAIISPKRR